MSKNCAKKMSKNWGKKLSDKIRKVLFLILWIGYDMRTVLNTAAVPGILRGIIYLAVTVALLRWSNILVDMAVFRNNRKGQHAIFLPQHPNSLPT